MRKYEKKFLAAFVINIFTIILAIILFFCPIFKLTERTDEKTEGFPDTYITASAFDLLIGHSERPVQIDTDGGSLNIGSLVTYDFFTALAEYETEKEDDVSISDKNFVKWMFLIFTVFGVFLFMNALRLLIMALCGFEKRYFTKAELYIHKNYDIWQNAALYASVGLVIFPIIVITLVHFMLCYGETPTFELNYIILTIILVVACIPYYVSQFITKKSVKKIAERADSFQSRSLFCALFDKPKNNEAEKYATESQRIETIEKYKELLDKGIITQEEFEKKKKDLLE